MQAKESTIRRWAAQLSRVLLVVLLAGSANAATFSVASQGSNLTWQTASTVLPILGNTPTYGGIPSFRWRPEGYPTIMGTGSGPVSLTIAPGLVNKSGYTAVLPVPSLPSYVQFTTGQSAYAPQAGSTATFKPGPKGSRPANFSWCPGAVANPACTTALTGGPGTSYPGLIKYTAGTAGPQYGGTMAVLITGRFTWVTVQETMPTYKVKLNNYDPVATAMGLALPAGQGYGNSLFAPAGPPAGIYPSPPFVPTPYSVYSIITNLGTATATTPAQSGISFGMPFTTGTVYVKVPFYPSPFLTITGMGADNRTAMGSGNITMVSGGIAHVVSTGFTIPQIVTMTLNVPEPSRVLMLASGAGLIGLVAVARRRASARAE